MDRRQALRRLSLATAGACLARPLRAQAVSERPPVLRRSDVVFMYQAERAAYADYAATVLAWGGTPTPESLEAARGVAFYGSVGMVTEFAAYHGRFPTTWDAGLCRDVHGQPMKVPWLPPHPGGRPGVAHDRGPGRRGPRPSRLRRALDVGPPAGGRLRGRVANSPRGEFTPT